MRAALYARVSTDRQAEKYGIPSQVEALKKRCLERAWEVLPDGDREAFIDDGYSGAELDRPALNRLRQAVKEGKVNVVLAYDPDRLSRKLFHQMLLAEEFERQSIKLEFITQEVGSSPEDRMFFNMRGLIAEYEREKIRERTLRGKREKARQGKVVSAGSLPFGYRYNPEKESFEEDPEKAQFVRLAFYTYASEDISLLGLADRFNRLRIPTPKGGKKWYPSALGLMLRNEAYIGKLYQFKQHAVEPKRRIKPHAKVKKTSVILRPREEWMAVPIPALVTPELFEAVQRKLARNSELARRNTKREYLLAGLLRCGTCGSRMGGHFHRGLAYYRCYKTRATNAAIDDNGNPQPCRCPEIRTASIEPVVWEAISQLIKDPDFLVQELRKRNSESSETRQVLERELSLSQERLKALPQEQKRLVEGYRKGLYPDFIMREEMERIQDELSQLEKQKAELEKRLSLLTVTESQEQQIRALVNRIGLGLDNLDFPQRQELLRLLVERICYNGEKVEILTIIPLSEQLHPLHREGD